MEENEKGMGLGELLHRAFLAVKRRFVFVLVVILIFAAGGYVIAQIRKPFYTASERVLYQAGDENTSPNVTSSYFESVKIFCGSGCVVDRANFYYDYYVYHTDSLKTVIDKIEAGTDEELKYDTSKIVSHKWITQKNLMIYSSSATEVSYMLTISYTDPSYTKSYEKLKIILCAIGQEINAPVEGSTSNKYFGEEIKIQDFGSYGISSDWSKSKIITIATVIGIIVALLSVYAINLTDRTIREKKDIERITGVSLLAFIEDQEA